MNILCPEKSFMRGNSEFATGRDEEYVGKRAMGIEVQGSRRRGRPTKRWADCVNDDLREKGLSGEEVYGRAAWRRLSSHIDPT